MKLNSRIHRLLTGLLVAAGGLFDPAGADRGEPHPYDQRVWQVLKPAMLAFQDGGSRRAFLETCQRLRTEFPGSRYDEQLNSLIPPLAREQASPAPAFLDKDPAQRTIEETIQSWIYQLRDLADQSIMKYSFTAPPQPFSRGITRPTPADRPPE